MMISIRRIAIAGILTALCSQELPAQTNYYVNDTNLNGDVYTTVAGSSANSGQSPSQPMDTIQGVLDTYDLGPGDVIWVDTGIYTSTASTVNWDTQDQGGFGNPVVLQGSTNALAGGTVLLGAGGGNQIGLYLNTANDVAIRDMIFRANAYGVYLIGSDRFSAENVWTISNTYGVIVNSSAAARFERCAIVKCFLGLSSGPGTVFENGIFWDNSSCAIDAPNTTPVRVTNTVFAQSGGHAYQDFIWLIQGDHNAFWLRNGATFAQDRFGTFYTRLSDFQQAYTQELRSSVFDPQVADAAALDFHPKSEAGRYVPGAGWTNDLVTSALVDFGDPASVFTNEPAPNGGRVNAGNYGNTWEASKSRTNAWLLALTFNDGGTLSGTGEVTWVASTNLGAGATVRIEYSLDGGGTWQVVATNIAASQEEYLWDTTVGGSSARAKWRVVWEGDTNVWDGTDNIFTLRNAGVSFTFYVNDTNTAGDVYTTAAGSSANTGTTAADPMDSLYNVLAAYDLGPGDTVYIDTGYYYTPSTHTAITTDDQGAPGNPLSIVGSTNGAAGGTVLDRGHKGGGSSGLYLDNANDVSLKHLRLRGGNNGLYLYVCSRIYCDDVMAYSNDTGFGMTDGSDRRFVRCVALGNTYGMQSGGQVSIENGVFWDNSTCAIDAGNGSSVRVTNTVFAQSGGYAYQDFVWLIQGDRNVFWLRDNAKVVYDRFGTILPQLSDFQQAYTQELRSSVFDPQVADAAALDFHPKSEAGRYVPGAGWTNDLVTSALVDFGDPVSVFTNEPAPNGGRVNAGNYGNTWEASKSRTNAWLLALTFNDGGTLSGTGEVTWVASTNLGAGATVRIEYSLDGGGTWQVVATNIAASQEEYLWDTTVGGSSARAKWRVVWEGDTNVWDGTDNIFTLRNAGASFAFYVNDTNTAGDVYTTAAGSSTNTGTTAADPMDSLYNILAKYNLGPGDTVYIDTGYYLTPSTHTAITTVDQGAPGNPLNIVGSTNVAAGGTVLDRGFKGGGSSGLYLDNANDVSLKHLRLRGGNNGLYVYVCSRIYCDDVMAYSNDVGFGVTGGSDRRFVRCVASGNTYGMQAAGQVSIENSVFWDNFYYAIEAGNGSSVKVTNTVFAQSGGYAYQDFIWLIQGDRNVFWLRDNAKLAQDRFSAISARLWDYQEAYDQEPHSSVFDPQVADAAALDFHPKSEAGRYVAGVGWTNDLATSALVDFGDPASVFTNEPAPNGGRVNAGNYGNTWEASKSRTNAWLLALTFNDGGNISATQALYWIAQNFTNGATVRVEYSADGGSNWSVVASGIAATSGVYVVSPAALASSFNGRWRVIGESDGSVSDANDAPITVNRQPTTFYVNDASVVGDMYASAPGNDANDGLTAGTPKGNVESIVNAYDLDGGDLIYIDTGTYTNQACVIMKEDGGSSVANRLVIQGSTNAAAGGTVLRNTNTASNILTFYANVLGGPSHVTVRDVAFQGGRSGIYFQHAGGINHEIDDVSFTRLLVCSNAYGIAMDNQDSPGTGVRLDYSVIAGSGRIGIQWSDDPAYALSVNHCVIQEANASGLFGAVGLSNSIVTVSGPVNVYDGAGIRGDYNVVFATGGAVFNGDYLAMGNWVDALGFERHSLFGADPKFADPAALDFHLKSVAGRYVPGYGWTNDLTTSPAIDAADPGAAFTNEPAPNGGRLDAGLYGNTPEASASRSDAWLQVLSLNGGGTVRGTTDLFWISGHLTATAVRVEFSIDDGNFWSVIASNVPAALGTISWDTTAANSSAMAKWRVISEYDTNVFDQTAQRFVIRNGVINYYVNDDSTAGDVYASAAGDDANNGLSPATPKRTVNAILDDFDLEGRDLILVDTGVYTNQGVLIATEDGGHGEADRVVLQGSTNWAAGGSIIDRGTNSGSVLDFRALRNGGPSFVTVRDFTLRGGQTGIYFEHAFGTNQQITADLFENLTVVSNAYGVNMTDPNASVGPGQRFDRCTFAYSSQRAVTWSTVPACRAPFTHCTVFAPSGSGLQGEILLTNSIVVAGGSGNAAFGSATIDGDYNLIYCTSGAVLNAGYEHLGDWSIARGREQHSFAGEDPLFADPAALDFHVRSTAGRYQPGTGWVLDGVDSPAIDLGDPAWPFALEPQPNGGIVNAGAYGNTFDASKSRTNAWLLALTLNDGGTLRTPDDVVYWLASAAMSGQAVRVELSLDGGATWALAASNILAGQGFFQWTNTNFGGSTNARWRVVSETDTNVSDATDAAFSFANDFIDYFVNDNSRLGDVYSTAVGNDANSGLAPALPKASLQSVLAAYDLKRGDRVFVDTGIYLLTNNLVIAADDSGSTSISVVVQGSTNEVWPTAFKGGSLVLSNAMSVDLRNLNVQGGVNGVEFMGSTNCTASWVQSQRHARYGFVVTGSVGSVFHHCVAMQNATGGLLVATSTGSTWDQGVLWDNGLYGVRVDHSTTRVDNTVIGCLVTNAVAYYIGAGSAQADFNDLWLRNGAAAAFLSTNSATVRLVAEWAAVSGEDVHSLSHQPDFADARAGDFHEKTTRGQGRHVRGYGQTNDAVASLLIDAGDPAADIGGEQTANGNRANIGLFGGSSEASRSPSQGWYVALSLNDGDQAQGTQTLAWIAGGAATGDTVALRYSPDGGSSWTNIAGGVAAGVSAYAWDTTGFAATTQGFWMVVGEQNTNLSDRNDAPFTK